MISGSSGWGPALASLIVGLEQLLLRRGGIYILSVLDDSILRRLIYFWRVRLHNSIGEMCGTAQSFRWRASPQASTSWSTIAWWCQWSWPSPIESTSELTLMKSSSDGTHNGLGAVVVAIAEFSPAEQLPFMPSRTDNSDRRTPTCTNFPWKT